MLYGLRTDGRQNLGVEPTVHDGGLLQWQVTFKYQSSRDADGGSVPFEVTESHNVRTRVETIEERFSECPLGQEPSISSRR